MEVEMDAQSLASLADRIAAQLAPKAIETITFGELFDLYYERHVKTRLKNWDNARYFFQVHGSHWRDVPVHKMQRGEIQQYVDDYGARVSQSSASRALHMVRSIINWGVRRGFLPPITNPCVGVENFKPVSRERFLGPAELVRFKAVLDSEKPIMRDFFWIALVTGQRKANVLSMRWDEIDFDLATWTIPAGKFKNGTTHVVCLAAPALLILQRRQRQATSPFVFPGKGKSGHLEDPKKAWKRIIGRAQITEARVHDLRRTMGSYLAIEGHSPYIIAKALGHKDMRSAATYARLDLKAVRKAIGGVVDAWEDIVALPTTAPQVEPTPPRQIATTPARVRSAERISAVDQVMAEARILGVLRASNAKHGLNTRKHFHQSFGGKLRVIGAELTRILSEMESRHLIESFQDDYGIVRYSVSKKVPKAQSVLDQPQEREE